MIIDGLRYEVEGYRLGFRLTKKRLLILAGLATLALVTGMAVVHADPTIWPTWSAGGGGKMFRM